MAFKVGGDFDDESTGDLAEINIVPLVDVMLVLLIIFMVAAPLSIGGISINLPSSKARSSKVEEQRVILSINKKGDFYLDKLQIPKANLEEKLKAIYDYRKEKDLYIRADKAVAYGSVIDAMSAAKIAGVDKISMLTESKKIR